jgi:hypothetical protein
MKPPPSFPSPFVRALANDAYSREGSDFTVTQLCGPPQRTYLEHKGHTTVSSSAYQSFMALLGTAVHNILEANVKVEEGELAEIRNYETFVVADKEWVVSGKFDFYESTTLFDYKVTGGIQEQCKPEHYNQVFMNSLLAEANGITVNHCGVVYMQRDWSYLRSTLDPSYPSTPFKIFVHDYDKSYAKEVMKTKLAEHVAAAMGNPRDCTLDEQWRKSSKWALKKPDGKRARKLVETYFEAEEEKKPGEIIEERKGEPTYCLHYCGYSNVCPQFLRELQASGATVLP